MITIIPIEPLNQAHGTLIVAAFSRFFIDGGGLANGTGDSDSDGDGWGDGDKIPKEWRTE